jgi:hypothetical protein
LVARVRADQFHAMHMFDHLLADTGVQRLADAAVEHRAETLGVVTWQSECTLTGLISHGANGCSRRANKAACW